MEESEIEKIKNKIIGCKRCRLHLTKTKYVPGDGNIHSTIMFIGEAPGYWEDKKGLPFVGRAGELLNDLLSSINIKREDVFITNILKCRPPNNRDPKEDEIEACSPYLHEQIRAIKPKIIVCLGRFAKDFIFKKFDIKNTSLSNIHGKIYNVSNIFFRVDIIPMYHPASALYRPEIKSMLFKDFKVLKKLNEKIKYGCNIYNN